MWTTICATTATATTTTTTTTTYFRAYGRIFREQTLGMFFLEI